MSDEQRSVTIDRLVLRGLPVTRGEGERIRALVETELARRLNAPEAEIAAGARARVLAAPPLPSSALRDPVRLAGSVAAHVAGAIAGKARP